MPSSYQTFYVKKQTAPGVVDYVGAGVNVVVRVHGSTSTLTTLTTNSSSQIVGGTLSVAAGTVVHFCIDNMTGVGASGTCSQTTT